MVLIVLLVPIQLVLTAGPEDEPRLRVHMSWLFGLAPASGVRATRARFIARASPLAIRTIWSPSERPGH